MQQSIVHLVTPAEVGGLESAVHLLAASQHARGHDVRVIASIAGPNAAAAWIGGLRNVGVPVLPIVSSGRDYLGDWRRIRRECAEYAPDVVHTHGYRADVLGGGAARAAGCRTVTTVHGFLGGDWKNRVYERLQRRAFRHFDAVVAVSRRMGEELSERSLPQLHVVPNAFCSWHEIVAQDEARAALGLRAEEFCVGWVGRLSHEKGADVMVRALAENAMSDVHLSIVGDGPERNTLRGSRRRSGSTTGSSGTACATTRRRCSARSTRWCSARARKARRSCYSKRWPPACQSWRRPSAACPMW
jgi:glycosyltransferase involved in cell wall biosynthesis